MYKVKLFCCFVLDFTPPYAVLCVILLGIMEKFLPQRNSMLPSRIYQPDTSKENFEDSVTN